MLTIPMRLLAALIICFPVVASAQSFHYEGNITFLLLSGKDCGDVRAGGSRPFKLAAEVQGKRISGYSQMQDASPGRFSGDHAVAMTFEYPDTEQAAGNTIALHGFGTASLSGELREKLLKPDEAGCNLSHGQITAQQTASGKDAEALRLEVAAAFLYAQGEYIARNRDPQAYDEILRLLPDLAKAETEGSENPQQAVLLREQLQPLIEKVYGLLHLQTLTNLTLRARLLKQLQRPDQALPLRERALEIAEKKFPDHVAISAYTLGDTLELLGRKEQALAAFGKAVQADEKQYGAGHPEVASDLARQANLYQELAQFEKALPLFQRVLAIREKALGLEHPDMANSLNNLAGLYDTWGKYDKALPLYQRALAIREKVSGAEHADTALACSNLAAIYQSLGQYDKALPLNQRALAIREKILGASHAGTATSLNNLSVLYDFLGKYEQALPLQQRALAIREKSQGPDHPDTANSLNNLAGLYSKLGLYDQALPLNQRALAIREKVLGAEHGDTARSLNSLAEIYRDTGQYNQALPLYQRALAIREKPLGPEHPDTATSLYNLAALYRSLGQYDKALPLNLRNLAICEKVLGPEHTDTAMGLNDLGLLYQDVGLYDRALPLHQRAVAIHEKVLGPDHAYTATALDNLAKLYEALGQYNQSLPLKLRALAIREKTLGPEHDITARSLNNLASLHGLLGQYDKALPLNLRALAIKEKTLGSEHASTAISVNNLAELYVILGEYNLALPLYRRALEIREKVLGPEHADTTSSLGNLAVLYDTLGQYAPALPLLQRALANDEKVFGENHPDTATDLNNLAGLYDSMGQYELALPLYQRALAINEKILGLNHGSTALGLNNLAAFYNHTHHPEQALPLYQRAYRSALSAQVPEILKSVQSNLGDFYAAQSNPTTAIFYLKQAVNTMQSIRAESRGLDKGLQKSLLKKNEEVYKQLAHLLVAAGRLAEAQQVLAMLKEDEYFDFIRRDAQADTRGTRMNFSGAELPFAGQLDKIGNASTALVDQLNALDKQARLAPTPELERQRASVNAQLGEQQRQTLALLDDIPQQLPAAQQRQLEQQRAEQAQLAAGVQKQLAQLGQGVTLIQYLLLGDKIQIILTDAKQQIAREAPLGEAALYPKLVALRKALEDPRLDPRPLAQELYQSLIAPVEADIGDSQTLMLSLDGALRYIPFSALYDGKHYLVERYRLALYTAAAKDKLTAAPSPQWKISGLGVTQAHTGFSALPGVKAELAGIIGKNGIPGETHLDQEFTASQMQTSLKQGNPVLHLASHFQFTPGTEADSYLLLGDGSHLSLKDIRQGDYPFGQLDLLTLSACATAMHGGQETNGKEVEGFGALAQNKGAKGVLATLWPIADASTAQLMQTLYRTRQQQHLNKAEALRQAQLALLKGEKSTMPATRPDERGAKRVITDGQSTATGNLPFQTNPNAPFAHPYFWAPFILMGNWL